MAPTDPTNDPRDIIVKSLLGERAGHATRIAELEKKLEAGEARVAELEEKLGSSEAKLAASKARIAELEAEVTRQGKQLELVVEKLGQNSTNSNLPPSSDGPGAAKKREGRDEKGKDEKGKRKRGGQKGHRGMSRVVLPPDQVDEFIDLYPEVCECCASTLPKTLDCEPKRHQIVDLVPFAPHHTEFRRHEVACPRCGHRTRAAYDPKLIPSSSFGPRLTAIIVAFTGAYHLSRDQVRQLVFELYGLTISTGTISTMEARATKALAAADEEARREVENAAVKHADATSWLQAGVTLSLWTLVSKAATVYRILKDGRSKTIQPLFGALVGILVSDRATVFGFWAMKLRQICHAHLLRKFISFSERDGPAGAIGNELVDCSMLMFEYWHAFRDGELTREELESSMRPLARHFEAVLERAAAAGIKRLSGSCADILAHRDALWTFVTHEDVGPTNNDAERALRSFVLWRKKSFGTQSERGNLFAARVMTVVQTARKQGKDVLDFLTRSISAQVTGTTPPVLIEAT